MPRRPRPRRRHRRTRRPAAEASRRQQAGRSDRPRREEQALNSASACVRPALARGHAGRLRCDLRWTGSCFFSRLLEAASSVSSAPGTGCRRFAPEIDREPSGGAARTDREAFKHLDQTIAQRPPNPWHRAVAVCVAGVLLRRGGGRRRHRSRNGPFMPVTRQGTTRGTSCTRRADTQGRGPRRLAVQGAK